MFILLVEYGLVHRGDCINCETCYFCFDLAFVWSNLGCADFHTRGGGGGGPRAATASTFTQPELCSSCAFILSVGSAADCTAGSAVVTCSSHVIDTQCRLGCVASWLCCM